jgi:hypothetical protein
VSYVDFSFGSTRQVIARLRRGDCANPALAFLQLLRQPDLAYQFRVPQIGSQGVERKVGPNADQPEVGFLECGVEPLEGMFPVAQIGI